MNLSASDVTLIHYADVWTNIFVNLRTCIRHYTLRHELHTLCDPVFYTMGSPLDTGTLLKHSLLRPDTLLNVHQWPVSWLKRKSWEWEASAILTRQQWTEESGTMQTIAFGTKSHPWKSKASWSGLQDLTVSSASLSQFNSQVQGKYV